MILNNPQRFAKTLKMHDFPFPQELDGSAYVRILYKPQNIVVGAPGFLLGGQIFGQVRNGIPF